MTMDITIPDAGAVALSERQQEIIRLDNELADRHKEATGYAGEIQKLDRTRAELESHLASCIERARGDILEVARLIRDELKPVKGRPPVSQTELAKQLGTGWSQAKISKYLQIIRAWPSAKELPSSCRGEPIDSFNTAYRAAQAIVAAREARAENKQTRTDQAARQGIPGNEPDAAGQAHDHDQQRQRPHEQPGTGYASQDAARPGKFSARPTEPSESASDHLSRDEQALADRMRRVLALGGKIDVAALADETGIAGRRVAEISSMVAAEQRERQQPDDHHDDGGDEHEAGPDEDQPAAGPGETDDDPFTGCDRALGEADLWLGLALEYARSPLLTDDQRKHLLDRLDGIADERCVQIDNALRGESPA